MVEELLCACGTEEADVVAASDECAFHPGRCARLSLGGEPLGVMGELHPDVLENYGIGVRCFVATLDFDLLWRSRCVSRTYHSLPKFPAVTRDLAFVCDKDIPVLTLQKAIRAAGGARLERVALFDVYQGKQVPEGKKSMAYSLTLQSEEKTLTDEDTTGAVKEILEALKSKLGAELR